MDLEMIDDGVIKYKAVHTIRKPFNIEIFSELDEARTKLFDLGLIGAYSNGIGYGNVSIRYQSGCIISGTSTGGLRQLGSKGYSFVKNYDLNRNAVVTEGPIQASSESMTHCAIYDSNHEVRYVLHVHQLTLWERLLNRGYPATPRDVAYGTPQMAQSIAALVKVSQSSSGLFAMAGHQEGVISYGHTISEAMYRIESLLR
jgi:ribulose-5-phosphate 4-epimerase/fuculose-1-phosphate aldolase